MATLVFDIETVPDLPLVRKVYDWSSLTDDETHAAVSAKFQVEQGTTFLPLHLHRIVAISVVLRQDQTISVWSLGNEQSDELDLIHRFFQGVERFTPVLVSWNGTGFDLPVLHYRAMKNRVVASQYWETGDRRTDFRYNNYVSRYHQRHTDVMDVVSLYQGRATAKLDQVALMLGYPGKMGMAGDQVYDAFRNGQLKAIRDYCETDVLNTYLVYLRYQLMRGQLTAAQLEQEEELLRDYLLREGERPENIHLQQFLEAWLAGSD